MLFVNRLRARKQRDQKSTKTLPLRTQLVAFYLVLSLLLLLCTGAAIRFGSLHVLQKQSEDLVLRNLHQAEYNIEVLLREVDTVSKQLSIEPSVQDFLLYEQISEPESVEIMKSLLQTLEDTMYTYNYLDAVLLFREDGQYAGSGGGYRYRSQQDASDSDFYRTPYYKAVQEAPFSLVWSGTAKMQEITGKSTPKNSYAGKNYLIAARKIRGLYEAGQVSTLVLGLNERAMSAIYKLLDYPDSSIYIMDSSGCVISSSDSTQIGEQHAGVQEILAEGNGSFVTSSPDSKRQVVYLKMQNRDWIMAMEVPMNAIFQYAGSLTTIAIVASALGLFAIILIYVVWIYRVTAPIGKLVIAMQKLQKGDLTARVYPIPGNEIGFLMNQFNEMGSSISALVEENALRQEKQMRLELSNLQSQINPHFLYNTLNTIKWMAVMIHANNIVDCITALGNLIRPLYKENGMLHTIGEELTYLENYITIMQYRFGGKIHFSIACPQQLKACMSLRFILQPIVENAITHGATGEHSLSIQVRVDEEEGDIVFCVEDDGAGITPEKLRLLDNRLQESPGDTAGGIGLHNVQYRLKYYFGAEYGISLKSLPGAGTVVSIRIKKLLDET